MISGYLSDRTFRLLLLALGAAWTVVWWWGATTVGDHGDLWPWWTFDYRYGGQPGEPGFYAWSPAFVQLMTPLRVLPFTIVVWIWGILMLASLIYAAGKWTPLVVIAPPVLVEFMVGNLNLLYAAAIVLGFRYQWAWALILLTKVTPGVGLLWFAVRREWRALGIAIGLTSVIAAGSILIAPGLWLDWFGVLIRGAGGAIADVHPNSYVPVPLLVRLPLAAVIVVWGALTDRQWTVPVGATLALPVLWTAGLSILVAVPALHRHRQTTRPTHEGSATSIKA